MNQRLLSLLTAALLAALAGCRDQTAPAVPHAPAVVAAVRDAGPVDPVTAQGEAILVRTLKAAQCFNADMRDLHLKDPRFAEYERNAFTDAFAFHAVFDHPKRIEGEPAAVCAEIGEEYQRLYLATLAKRRPPAPGAVVPVPPPTIDSLPDFIHAAGGATALHVLEHGEITRAAFVEATGGKSRPIFDVASFGAQISDLVRWGDVRSHGQTEDFDPALRESSDEGSQAAFVGRVIVSIGSFVTAAREEKYPRAAIWLGTACHAVQDLAYHHGMSRQQLAGLRYFLGKDPAGPAATAARADAKRWTKQIIALAKETLHDEVRWQRLINANPTGYNRTDALKTLFNADPPVAAMTFGNLATHWIQHLVYRLKPETRSELGDGPTGLIQWDAATLLQRVRRDLANSGIAFRATGKI